MIHSTTLRSKQSSAVVRAAGALTALSLGLLTAGCGASHPVIYQSPNAVAGDPIAQEQAINDCIALSQQAGAGRNQTMETGKKTATAAAVGGAAGAAAGAVRGHAGRGAGMGAAGAAAGSLTHSIIGSGGLDDLEKRYVETCLRERGYQTIGWR